MSKPFVWSWCLETAAASETSKNPRCLGLLGESISAEKRADGASGNGGKLIGMRAWLPVHLSVNVIRLLLLVCVTAPICMLSSHDKAFGSSIRQAVSSVPLKPPSDCIRLLTSTTKFASLDVQFENRSAAARAYLSLIDLGLQHLSMDSATFFKSLEQMSMTDAPTNPFIDLPSPLGQALAKRSEALLAEMDGDWSLIQQGVAARIKASAATKILRHKDEEGTRFVTGMLKASFSFDSTPPRIEDMYYIGETQNGIIFGLKESRWSGSKEWAGTIYRLSKGTRELTLLDKISVPDGVYENMQWMHNGFIYGFAQPGIQKPGQPPQEARVFRLDPETGQRVWAGPWIQTQNDRQPLRIAHRLHVSNSIVGVELSNKPHAIGEVYRFDYDRLQFVATGLTFDETTLPHFQSPAGDPLSEYIVLGSSNELAMRIGRFFKTNGLSVAQIGDSAEWRHWSAGGVVRTEQRVLSRNKFELRLYENLSVQEKQERDGTGRKPSKRAHIKLRLNGQYFNSSYESVDNGSSIVFLANAGSTYPMIILLIDRSTWTAQPMNIVGGPTAIGNGKWQLVRTQSDDLLLRYDYGWEVALWRFDSITRRFVIVLHDVFPQSDERANPIALLDYDKQKLIAWVYKDRDQNPVMWAGLPLNLSRDQDIADIQEGSKP